MSNNTSIVIGADAPALVHQVAVFQLAEINALAQLKYSGAPLATLLHVSTVPGEGNEFKYRLGYVLPQGAVAPEGTPFLNWSQVLETITGVPSHGEFI